MLRRTSSRKRARLSGVVVSIECSTCERTLVRRGATLGANCTVVCGSTIGAYAFVGAGAVVTADVSAYALVVGVPARQVGWMSAHGERLALPVQAPPGEVLRAACPGTGQVYELRGSVLSTLDGKP